MAGKPGCGGRPRLSAQEHLLRGTYRKDRHGPLEPGQARILPMPATRPPLAADAGTPTALSDLERAKWDEMLLAYPSANRDLLWLYCSTWCDWRAARDGVKLVGPIIRDPKNRPMLNPHLVIARETQKLLADMLIVLGRTEARDATRAPATRLEKFLASKRR